jgi:hypothetical protein
LTIYGCRFASSFNHFKIDRIPFYESLEFWTKDGALEVEPIEQTDEIFSFNVTRCRYAELYEKLGILELGTSLSCARDFALIKGFSPNITLKRTQTLMEGADFCDFRYQVQKKRKKHERCRKETN